MRRTIVNKPGIISNFKTRGLRMAYHRISINLTPSALMRPISVETRKNKRWPTRIRQFTHEIYKRTRRLSLHAEAHTHETKFNFTFRLLRPNRKSMGPIHRNDPTTGKIKTTHLLQLEFYENSPQRIGFRWFGNSKTKLFCKWFFFCVVAWPGVRTSDDGRVGRCVCESNET